MDEVTKTGICDSCGQDRILYATPHNQASNPKLFWYCEVCKFAHDKEKKVQAALRVIAATDALAAEDPAVLSHLHEQAGTQLLIEKAKNDTLAPNEEIVGLSKTEVVNPQVVEGEIVSE